jgi:hypothetical protein
MGIAKKIKKIAGKVGKASSKFVEGKTGNKLLDVGSMALSGDVYGLQQEGFKQLGKAIGKKNLRAAQNFGEKTMGEKNYKTTARVIKRGNRIGANATSAYLAYARGDPVMAAKYGGDVAEASMGTKALREAHKGVAKAIGEKNYQAIKEGYKGARHGAVIGYNLAHLKNTDDAYNAQKSALNAAKLGLAGVHVAASTHKAYEHFTKQHNKQIGKGVSSKPTSVSLLINKKKPIM